MTRPYKTRVYFRKRMAAKVRQQTSELKRLHFELAESQRKLRQAEQLSDLGKMSATVSHEIRNPLSVIRNAIHVVRKKAEMAGLDLDRPLDRALRSVARCDDIVGDMLEYARSSKVNKVLVNSSDYLNELLDEQTLPAGVVFKRELPTPGLDIAIDCDRFRRVIINLISNAADAIKEGGIENGEITVTCRPDEDRQTIHVKNNGPAISPEVLERMFEPMYTTKSTGFGIGLPTVRKLIEEHGAELQVDTQVDVGTTWSIILQPMSGDAVVDMQPGQKAMAA
ncbi:MAG: sensor histidine kinase [Hyphomicrobiaceae bacterium]